MKRLLPAALLCVCAVLAPGTALAAAFSPGAPGTGDPYYPLAGNGGYDVGHYGLKLAYQPAGNRLAGKATVSATATQNLARFDLDLTGFTVKAVAVDGAPAAFSRDGQELVITPAAGIPDGSAFTVAVQYAGVPELVADVGLEGWIPTDDGAFVACEPVGSPGWYPVNDEPADKATFDFTVTVPKGLTAMCNGVLLWHRTAQGKTTWRWSETDPMSPYLATSTLGRFDLTEYEIDGIPTYVAVDPTLPKGQVLGKLPAIVRFFVDLYGEYPFNAAGAIVDNAKFVDYALETQTKPIFDRMPDEWTLVHETRAHVVRGFGDADRLVRDLAERRVRHVVQLDLERGTGQEERPAVVQAVLQRARTRLDVGCRDRGARRSGHDVGLGRRVPAWGDDAAGAAREDRRRGLLRNAARVGGPAQVRQRDDGAVRGAR